MGLTAHDAMFRLEDCIQGDDTVLNAARRMAAINANSLPVVERDGSPLGTLVNADIVRSVASASALDTTRVAELIDRKHRGLPASAPAVGAGDSLESILDSMKAHRTAFLTVVEAGRPVGVVRRSDVEAFSYEPPDGLPLPPPGLIEFVSGSKSARAYRSFYSNGARSAETVRSVLERNGTRVESLQTMLDFGCGCGRVIRHWRDLDVGISGTDYNASLIDWCAANLRFAKFQSNGLVPELDYPDSAFDFIYAFSVFTHLRAELQGPWLTELKRAVRVGGLVMLTLHGLTRLEGLEGDDRQTFLDGELVVRRSEQAGTNKCAAHHPERYVRDVFGAELELLEFTPNGAPEISQDVALFRNTG